CGRRVLTHRQHSAERRGGRHTLQAEKAVEPRRPRARPLTLCLLRMKREDFITSCKPRLHPSSLPPSQPSHPPLPPSPPHSLTPRFPSTLPASSTFQACPSQRRGSRLLEKNLPLRSLPALC
ncbi:hypothetical protein KUCAC02_020750, partial [Chaenocephalus aceratus]